MAAKPPDILAQFAEFLEAKTKAEQESEDFAVNLKTTGPDGSVHELTGIPVSRAAPWIYKTFGIGEDPDAESGGDGGTGGKPGATGQGGSGTVARLFGQQRAAGQGS